MIYWSVAFFARWLALHRVTRKDNGNVEIVSVDRYAEDHEMPTLALGISHQDLNRRVAPSVFPSSLQVY